MQTTYPARRRELISHSGEEALQLIRLGVLATLDPSASLEARPMNFVFLDGSLYFHTSPESALMKRTQVAFTGWCDEAWIPSYWRHPQQACPATTYYTSVVVRGELEVVEDLEVKAEVLAAFMQKYQPEGGYRPLSAAHKLYAGPLAALGVLRLRPQDVSCKSKYGQHVPASAQAKVLQGLVGRSDWRTADKMRQHCPALQLPEGFSPDASAIRSERLQDWLEPTHGLAEIERNRQESRVQWGYWEEGQLWAYVRVTGHWICDLVVAPEKSEQGIAQGLVEQLLSDPKLADLPALGVTDPVGSFWKELGFRRLPKSRLMIWERKG
jgi:nitroimidazol reductase NimA-like FMN-containing flavoprotein (pyridoxamine 5'-phosphate oxidase superfamily)